MINLFKDIANFSRLKKLDTNIKYCFFVENEFIFNYLEPYIKIKGSKKTIIVSFTDLKLENDYNLLIFKTFFFQSLFFLSHTFKYFITSTPDIDENFYYKKSKFSKTKYIYIQHSPLSLTKIYKEKAFVNFNLVQVVNLFQEKEIKKIRDIYNKKIKIYKSPYLFLKSDKKKNHDQKIKTKVLIAPTWSTNFFKLNIHEKIFKLLKQENIDFTFRPHPMSIKMNEFSLNKIKKKNINLDLKSKLNLNDYTDLISDWSGIFIEFALIKKKFPILINNSQKIRNKNESIYNEVPIEIFARDKIANQVNIDNLENIIKLLNKNDHLNENKIIENFRNDYFF